MPRRLAATYSLVLLLVFLVFASLAIGYTGFKPISSLDSRLLSIRVNRTALGLVVGMLLGVSGALLQYSVSNPLATPSILGVTVGALFGVEVSMIIFRGYPPMGASVLAGAIGGLVAYFISIGLAARMGLSRLSVVLAGIAVSSLFAGASYLLSLLISAYYGIHTAWLLVGTTAYATRGDVYLVAASLPIVFLASLALSRPLDAISYGDEVATSLGYSPSRVRILATLVASIATSLAIYVSGIIGFVDLVAPNVARLVASPLPHVNILLSAITGSVMLLSADVGGRVLALGVGLGEIPAGALTSIAGGVFLAYMIIYGGGSSGE